MCCGGEDCSRTLLRCVYWGDHSQLSDIMMCCREPCSYVIVVLEGYALMLPTYNVYILEGIIVRCYIYYSEPLSHVTDTIGDRFFFFHMLGILERTNF